MYIVDLMQASKVILCLINGRRWIITTTEREPSEGERVQAAITGCLPAA